MEKITHVVLKGSTRPVRPGAKLTGAAGPNEWIQLTIKLRRKKDLPVVNGRPATIITRRILKPIMERILPI